MWTKRELAVPVNRYNGTVIVCLSFGPTRTPQGVAYLNGLVFQNQTKREIVSGKGGSLANGRSRGECHPYRPQQWWETGEE